MAKKNFGTKTWMLPMPVLMIATYGESVLTDGKPDSDKIKPLAFDPLKHVYRGLTAPVAKAFQG